MSKKTKFPFKGANRKELLRQEQVKARRSEQQFGHIFTYITADGLETKRTTIVSKNIPSACDLFAHSFKNCFIVDMTVVPVDKQEQVMKYLSVAGHFWDVETGKLATDEEVKAYVESQIGKATIDGQPAPMDDKAAATYSGTPIAKQAAAEAATDIVK